MGGAATVAATSRDEIKDKISCILLWVPGVNEGDFKGEPDQIFEEGGQKYKGRFWIEARQADFFKCLEDYKGAIHLVYGEFDKYIKQGLRDKVVNLVKEKGQPTMILKGQDHSPWEFDIAQKVYEEELKVLQECFNN